MKKYFLVFIIILLITNSATADEIGKYEVNGEAFAIPKEYLLVSLPQGKTKSFSLLFHYPDMNPIKNKWERNDDSILISIEPYINRKRLIDGKEELFDSVKFWYGLNTGQFVHFGDDDSITRKVSPIFLGKEKNTELNVYKLPYEGNPEIFHRDNYIKGDDPIDPEYWITCNYGRCESMFKLTDKIAVRYNASWLIFLANTNGKPNHEILRELVEKKISNLLATKEE